MSVSGSVLDYIRTLEWPVVVGASIFYFRYSVTTILKRVGSSRKGSITAPGGAGISWDDTLEDVKTSVDHAQKADQPQSDIATQLINRGVRRAPRADISRWSTDTHGMRVYFPDSEWETIAELPDISPGAAVVMAFAQLESAIRRQATERGVTGASTAPLAGLVAAGSQTEDLRQAVRNLARLRNEVTHADVKPTEQEARSYVVLAKSMYRIVQRNGYRRHTEEKHADEPPDPKPNE